MVKQRNVRRVVACMAVCAATTAIEPAMAQSTFTGMTVIGDSYADTNGIKQILLDAAQRDPSLQQIVNLQLSVMGNGRFSNGSNFVDTLQRLYGIPDARMVNFAVGGARTDDTNTATGFFGSLAFPGMTQQRQQFLASGRNLGAMELAIVHMGGNDVFGLLDGSFGSNLTASQAVAIGSQRGAIIGDAVGELVRAGARTVVIGPPVNAPLFQPSIFAPFPGGRVALAPTFGQAYQDAAIASVVPYTKAGTRIVFFDGNLFGRSVIANPGAYGFTNVLDNCLSTPACFTASDAVRNQFFSWDGIHLTSAGFELYGRAIANILAAPESLASQGDVAQHTAKRFSDTLLARLDAMREHNVIRPSQAVSGAKGPDQAATETSHASFSPFTVYAQVDYGNGERSSQTGGPQTGAEGFDSHNTHLIIGAEHRPDPALLIGVAFNYADTSATLRGSAGKLDAYSYQLAGYGSYTGPNMFADAVVSYGRNYFDITRPGLAESLLARTDGDGLTASGKIGYLFDLGAVRFGPIANLSYLRTENKGYTERGEPFLTLTIGEQTVDSLTGGAGVQIRAPFDSALGRISPYVNLTVEHDFRDGRRTVVVGQTVAPTLASPWQIGEEGDRTYGKVVGGFSANLRSGLSVQVNASTTFAQNRGKDMFVSAGFSYHF